jgi:capsid protein
VGIFARIAAVFRRSVPIVHARNDRRVIQGSYDLAQTNDDNRRHWAAADNYDADSANSITVRRTTVKRSRYETNNNGYTKGISLTHANYTVGRGPKLRMQTASPGMNAMVQAKWAQWCNRVQLARKLRTAIKAKVVDGEAFLVAKTSHVGPGEVGLQIVGIECEQVTSTDLMMFQSGRIDGIWFDEFGTPTDYDVLPRHPGGYSWLPGTMMMAVKTPAKYVFHLFREDRPGQHRAIPELSSTLGTGAQSRRWREATLQAAENLADFSLFVKTEVDPDTGPGRLLPFDTLELQKGTLTALPSGGDISQPKVEQPGATYEGFLRTQVGEQARPLSMSYSLAACDSSNANFASAKLDQHPYFGEVDTDQADIEELVLDPLFALWFAEAVYTYGWTFDALPAPPHTWDWPALPIVSEVDTANSRKTNIATGVSNVPRIVAEDGYDAEEELAKEAEYYGVTVDEMRAKHFEANFQVLGSPPAVGSDGAKQDSVPAPPVPIKRMPVNRNGKEKVPA